MAVGAVAAGEPPSEKSRPTVLVVQDDAPLADLLHALLTSEGYQVAVLHRPSEDALKVAVGRLEPDCLLLDGQGGGNFGRSWLDAAWAHERRRPVPVVMCVVGSERTGPLWSTKTW